MQQTSIDAYHAKQVQLGKSARRVYRYIFEATLNGMDVTDIEIERDLGMRISSVTGRRNDLVKAGLVVKSRKAWNSDSRLWNWAWKAKL